MLTSGGNSYVDIPNSVVHETFQFGNLFQPPQKIVIAIDFPFNCRVESSPATERLWCVSPSKPTSVFGPEQPALNPTPREGQRLGVSEYCLVLEST